MIDFQSLADFLISQMHHFCTTWPLQQGITIGGGTFTTGAPPLFSLTAKPGAIACELIFFIAYMAYLVYALHCLH
jgi:hypothetical protein